MQVLEGMKKYNSAAALVLRLVIGAIFLYHGSQKFGTWSAEPSEQMPAMMLNVMRALSVIEPLAGLGLIVGFLTRVWALVLGITMIGAIYMKSMVWGVGFAAAQATGWEFDLMILAGCIMLFTMGAGMYSVDREAA